MSVTCNKWVMSFLRGYCISIPGNRPENQELSVSGDALSVQPAVDSASAAIRKIKTNTSIGISRNRVREQGVYETYFCFWAAAALTRRRYSRDVYEYFL